MTSGMDLVDLLCDGFRLLMLWLFWLGDCDADGAVVN